MTAPTDGQPALGGQDGPAPAGPDTPPAPPAPPVDAARLTRRTVRAGLPVRYSMTDPTNGRQVEGYGLVLDVPEDEGAAVVVAPLASHYLYLLPDAVTVVELDG